MNSLCGIKVNNLPLVYPIVKYAEGDYQNIIRLLYRNKPRCTSLLTLTRFGVIKGAGHTIPIDPMCLRRLVIVKIGGAEDV